MSLAERLRDYRVGRFTDEDVVRCTGLSARGWRELIKFGVVRTITENDRGRGHVRLCDATVFKRAAIIAALNRGRLQPSGGWPDCVFRALSYWSCLKFAIQATSRLEGATVSDTDRVMPLRLRKANARLVQPEQDRPRPIPRQIGWFKIHDRRFVSVVYRPAKKPVVFGDLREEGAKFVAWVPHNAKSQFVRSIVAQLAMEWAPAGDRYPRRCLGMGRADQVD